MNRAQQRKASKKVEKNPKSEDGKNISTKAKIDWLRNTVEEHQKILAEYEARISEITLLIGLVIDADDPEGALRGYVPKLKAWVEAHASSKTR